MNLTKHQKIFLFAILIVISITLLDIWSMQSGIFGTPENYTKGNFSVNGWWNLFFKFNLILIILISLSYYWFCKHDKSESFSLFIISLGLWFGGLPDLLFFWLRGMQIPSKLPWLDNNLIAGNLSKILGFSGVTNISLIISALISFIIVYFISKWMVEKL